MGRGIQRILVIFVRGRHLKKDMSNFSPLFLHLIYIYQVLPSFFVLCEIFVYVVVNWKIKNWPLGSHILLIYLKWFEFPVLVKCTIQNMPTFFLYIMNNSVINFFFKLQDYKHFVRLNFSATPVVMELPFYLSFSIFIYIFAYPATFALWDHPLRADWLTLWPSRLNQHVPVNHPKTSTTLHSVTSQASAVCFNWCFFKSVCDILFPPLPVTFCIIQSFICTHTRFLSMECNMSHIAFSLSLSLSKLLCHNLCAHMHTLISLILHFLFIFCFSLCSFQFLLF
jgi:hypothetical protein